MASTTSFQQYKTDPFGVGIGSIAVSKNPWPEFFGQPHFPSSSAYDVDVRDTQILPDAYKGISTTLRDRVEFLVYSDENWYTQVVMPVEVVTGSNKVSWNKTEYGTYVPGLVPELGTVRIMSSRKISGSASFERRGIGLYLEHGFMNTEAGRRDYVNQLTQIANSVLEGAKLDVINTLLNAQDAQREWETKHGQYKGRHLTDVLQQQLWMWAALQRYEHAERLLETKVNETMQKYRGRADTWIMPPQIQNYLSIAPKEMIEFWRAGPAGPQRLQDGPEAITTIGKSRVFFARSYEVDREGSRDLLTFPVEIGEYAALYDRNRDKSYKGYRSVWRHVQIYNEDEDKMFEVKLKWALDASQRFDADTGVLKPPSSGFDSLLPPQQRQDVFSYPDPSVPGKWRQTRYFGQIEPRYFETSDKMNLARTVVQAIAASYRDFEGLERAWQQGIDLVARIDALPLTADAGEGDNMLTGTATMLAALAQGPVNRFGGYDFPLEARSLLPGFASWAGMQAMAAAADRVVTENPVYASVGLGLEATTATVKGDAKANQAIAGDLNIAKRFVTAVRTIVAKLRAIFPNSALLDPALASPWWKNNVDAETTFFENVVAPYRVPLFYKKDATANTAANFKQLESLYDQLKGAITARAAGKPGITGDTVYGTDAVAATQNRPAVAGVNSDVTTQQRRTLVMTALAFVSKKKDGVETDPFDKVLDIARKASNTWLYDTAIDRDKFVQSVKDVDGAYAQWSRVMQRITDVEDKVKAAYENAVEANLPQKGYERTPLLASRAVIRSIADAKNTSYAFRPASPTNPQIPMSAHEWNKIVAKFGGGGGKNEDFYGNAISERIYDGPAAFGGIGAELGPESTLRAVGAASGNAGYSGAASFGAEAMMTGDEFDDGPVIEYPPVGRSGRGGNDRRQAVIAEMNKAPEMQKSWKLVNEAAGGDTLLAAIAHVYDHTPVHRDAFYRFIEQNIVVPIGFIVARPHMTYRMAAAIKCLAGREMGIYAQRPGRFEVGDDVDVQAHIGTYTYYAKAIVHEPKHVFLARNIFSAGYAGGNGVRPITPSKYVAGSGSNGQESVIVLAVPYAGHQVTGIMDLTGSVRMFEERFQLRGASEPDYIGVDFYNRLYGWREATQNGEDAWAASDYLNEKANVNTLCHPGFQLLFNPQANEFNVKQEGRGHWGQNTTYPGCAAVRRGELLAFDKPGTHFSGFIEAS